MKKFIKVLINFFFQTKFPIVDNLPRKLKILDIGDRWGIQWPWSYVNNGNFDIVLFEPDKEEAEILKKNFKGLNVSVIEKALWSSNTEIDFYINRSPGTSSTFLPNFKVLEKFQDLQRFDVMAKHILMATSIDHLVEKKEISSIIDFIKIDVQGAELEILKGGKTNFSKNLVGIEVEVEFTEIYAEQPVFRHVDKFITEELGLEIWDLRKSYWKYNSTQNSKGSNKGKLVFGDALYFRPINGLDTWLANFNEKEQLQKITALLMVTVFYGYLDYGSLLVEMIAKRFPDQKLLVDSLNKFMRQIGRNFRPFSSGNFVFYKLFDLFAKLFAPNHNNWATAEPHLGSKKFWNFWI